MVTSSFFPKVFAANVHGRDFAVGDIHGCFSALAAGLQSICFDPAKDRLFALGDIVNRGPESAAVCLWLEKPWFHSVRGNHDEMVCLALAGNVQALGFLSAYGGDWIHALSQADRESVQAALLALPLAMEIETAEGPVGLIHADLPSDDWRDVQRGLSLQDAGYCLWSIDRFQRKYTGFVRHIRAVIHGHMTIPRMTTLGNAFFIDTYATGSGQFTFLELSKLKALRGPGKKSIIPPTLLREE